MSDNMYWRNSKAPCLILQTVVSTHVQAVSPVSELLSQVLQRSASGTLQWFQSSFCEVLQVQ